MRLLPLACLAALTAAAPIVAQMPTSAPGAPDAKRITAGTYKIEPGHTQILFGVDHLGFNPYYGHFSDVSGTLTLDPARPGSASVDISVPIKSVKTTSTKLDAELISPQFFDAAKFPEMRFRSTSVTVDPRSPGRALVAGTLTLHGVTKPIQLEALFHGAGKAPMGSKAEVVGFEGRATIKRSDYGVSWGIPMVSDEVRLIITAAFEKSG